jgi:hypothetical protein
MGTVAQHAIRSIALALLLVVPGFTQSNSASTANSKKQKKTPGAAHEIGNGAGNIAGGAAKGAGSLAKGTGKGAVDLVTLHPIDAGTSVAKGAVGAGKNVSVGTVKGTGKVAKGIGKAVKHLF